jgi:hypothetical protein
MPMVRAFRLLNAIEAGTTTGTQLESILTGDSGRLGEFNAILGLRGQARRAFSSDTASTAIIASSAALGAMTDSPQVLESGVAMTAIANSTTALNAFINSPSALNRLVSSRVAMTAVCSSASALTTLVGTTTGRNAFVGSSVALEAALSTQTGADTLTASLPTMDLLYSDTDFIDFLGGSGSAVKALINSPNVKVLKGTSSTSWGQMYLQDPGNISTNYKKFIILGVATQTSVGGHNYQIKSASNSATLSGSLTDMVELGTSATQSISVLRELILAKKSSQVVLPTEGIVEGYNSYTNYVFQFLAIRCA